MGRLRPAEWIAGAGGVSLLAALWLDWYAGGADVSTRSETSR